MRVEDFDMGNIDIAWCPGCGNTPLLQSLMMALAKIGIAPQDLVMVSGIGQAAKIPQYMKCNYFNGLHGRALPPATAIKAANRGLTVIAESGDGDMYGEGGNHFIHTIRRNPNITNIVHNNMVYGLTKGQASPTSQLGFKTPVQVDGVAADPFNGPAVAIAMNASFVARAFSGDMQETADIIEAGIRHEGYALVEILQPCVTFNKVNTAKWFKENSYYLDKAHDPTDRTAAFAKVTASGPLPLGIIYKNPSRAIFENNLAAYKEETEPLFSRETDLELLKELMASSV